MIEPPKLNNDCFALPSGVDWIPVPKVFELLQKALHISVIANSLPVEEACGYILAAPIVAQRCSPPYANSAIDGYGFSGSQSANKAPVHLKLLPGRTAAGHPFKDYVPIGYALRVLTGASLPDGVDTIVLQEDVNSNGKEIAFYGPLQTGKNTRPAGEDIEAGQLLFEQGHKLCATDLAVLAAAGVCEVDVYAPLRVGVLSTGDELIEVGSVAKEGKIFDINRLMLMAEMQRAGFVAIDLGIAKDNLNSLRETLKEASQTCDVLLTTGGASTGDEDHMARLLRSEGSLEIWRVAVKPGRPMAMGVFEGLPVFGLPGNPVAAFVCALVFAKPALSCLAGAKWSRPVGYMVPAAFSKSKKPGRFEYLRAKLVDGSVEVFASEGSGRVTSLSWADGLVELGSHVKTIKQGEMVRYIPFSEF